MPSITRYRYLEPIERPALGDAYTFIDKAVSFIHDSANTPPVSERVELLASGGVDSSVVAALFDLAGVELYITHIDTGFMRLINGKEESRLVAQRFSDVDNFEITNARPLFYKAVFGVSDAEKKRIRFRDGAYRKVADQQIIRHSADTLADGTILPDIKETPIVKTQHNVDVPYKNVKKEIQPLAGLYKNEVRFIAKELYDTHGYKFLKDVHIRQPLPGPGLMIRAVGSIDEAKLYVEKTANDITEQIVDKYAYALYGTRMKIDTETGEQMPFQSFAATLDNKFIDAPHYLQNRISEETEMDAEVRLLGTKVTGIKGGKRVYNYAVCLEDNLYNYDYTTLIKMGEEVPAQTDFSRVLVKVTDGEEGAPFVIAIRSVRSVDAVTAYPFEIPFEILENIGNQITKNHHIGKSVAAVYFDVSPKLSHEDFTSATIEYE